MNSIRNNKFLLVIFALGLTLLFSNCRKESFLTGNASLTFDTDTVYFDTVFTKLPGTTYPRSINKQFVVRNPYKESIRTDIKLSGGTSSSYRMNVDGVSTRDITGVEIRPKDSIFVFVECSLEPNNLTMPAIVQDSIMFVTNGNIQNIQLAAYGWDAYYYRDSVLPCNTVWDKTDKPYVVVNSVAVDENCNLEIKPGVHIYSSGNSQFYVFGTLKVNGNKDNPVLFRADRLDPRYDDSQGQWIGIHFYRFSKDNEINYAIIKNAIIGVRVDSLSINGQEKLIMKNSIIQNCSNIGLLGITSDITLENNIIHNCGSYTFLGYFGGNYNLRHNTFANYNIGFSRNDPHFAFNNIQLDENDNFLKDFLLSYNVQNCIIYGSNDEEILFDISSNKPPVSANLENNIIRTEIEALNSNGNLVNVGHSGSSFFRDLLFTDYFKYDFTLKENSPAIDKGAILSPVISKDIVDSPRDAMPDIGAFEYLP